MNGYCGTSRRTVIVAMVLMVSLVVLVVPQLVIGASDSPAHEVRMTVDSTVLPPVLPLEAPLDEESVTVTPLAGDEIGGEIPPAVSVVPAAKQSPVKKADVEVVPAKKKDEVSAPKPEKKATPKSKPALTGKGEVRKITVQSTASTFVITVYCDRPIGDTSYMNLNNPKRLVIDMRQPWVHKARNVIRASSGAVKHVVTGNHPDRFRMVVHFRKPPKGRMVPNIKRDGNKLVVTVVVP